HARLIHQLAPKKAVRKALRRLEECIADAGDSAFERLNAMPLLERSVASLIEAARPAAKDREELHWWLTELSGRVAELEKLTVQFAPWASTRFRMVRATEAQQAEWIAKLSLANADRIYSE